MIEQLKWTSFFSFSALLFAGILVLSSCRALPADTDLPLDGQNVDVANLTEIEQPVPSETEVDVFPFAQTGVLELRLQMWPGSGQECVRAYPFTVRQDEGRILLSGDGQMLVECAFASEYCAEVCETLHVEFALDTRVDGEILPDSTAVSGYRLELYFFYDGQTIEYFSDYPTQISVQYIENSPLIENTGDLVSVSMPYEDGASAVLMEGLQEIDLDNLPVLPDAAVWALTLHIQ